MSEKEQSTGFKVVDKRRYGADGERSDYDSDVANVAVSENIPVKESETRTVSDSSEQHSTNREKLNFSSFVLGMYTQTLIFLGDIPHPETNQVSTNIEAAKQNIDILNILEEKTKGNLNPEENHLMTEVLDMLRLQFVSKK